MPSALTPAASLIYSPTPSSSPSQSVAAAPLNDSVHLASFQAQVAEEKWLMSEARESERRRKLGDARARARPPPSGAAGVILQLPALAPRLAVHQEAVRLGLVGLQPAPPPACGPVAGQQAAVAGGQHAGAVDERTRHAASADGSVRVQRAVPHAAASSATSSSPHDDLVDLAVRYDTTPELIRRHNRRVVFQHLDNVHGEYIHIPVSDTFVLPQPVLLPPSGDRKDGEVRASEDSYVVPGAGGLTNVELKVQSEINRQFYAVRSFLSQIARRRGASSLGGPRSSVVPHIGDAGGEHRRRGVQ